METQTKALEGVRILDLTQFLAGPVCTLNLGMMGAEIIKVERPEVGEQGRNDNHKYVYGTQTIKWAILHSNKKSITLNLKEEDGKEIFTELIKVSDVVIENYAPGTMEKLGFSYERIAEINPRCIFCQIKGYPDQGPFANFPGMDGPLQATSGLASQTGTIDSPPLISLAPLADAPTGDYATMGILAALFQRERTGRGQQIRINMQEVVLAYCRASFTNQEKAPKRGGAMLFSGPQAPRDMFRCKPAYEGDENNYVFMMVRDVPGQKMWRSFCDVIGRPELFEDPRFINGPTRLANVEELNKIVTEWTMQHDKTEVMRLLCEKMIPAGATLTIPDLCKMDYLYESGFLVKHDHPKLGQVTLPGSAIHMSDSPVDITPSPDLGDANDEIYKGLLGFTDEQIEEYKKRQVL